MGGTLFSPCSLAWVQTMVGIMAVMVISFKRIYAPRTVVFSVPDCWPMPPPETPGHSQASLARSLVGSVPLSPGFWCTQSFVCAHQEFISPVLWKFCNQIPLAFKVKFPEDSQSLCWIPRLGHLLWALELLQQCRNSFGIICLQCVDCLLGGSMVGLMEISSKKTYATDHTSQVWSSQSPVPIGDTADLCLHRKHKNTQTQIWLSLLWGSLFLSWVLVPTGFGLHPLSISGKYEVWPWSKKWWRTNANRVSPRKHTGHSKHPLPTMQRTTLHIDITRRSILKEDWLYSCSWRWRSSTQ